MSYLFDREKYNQLKRSMETDVKPQKRFINYTDNYGSSTECDNCDKVKQCVHFNLIRDSYVLCKDCISLLLNEF